MVVNKITLIVLHGLLEIFCDNENTNYTRRCHKFLVTVIRNEQITHDNLLILLLSVCRVVPATSRGFVTNCNKAVQIIALVFIHV
jgi:hypothetical protein